MPDPDPTVKSSSKHFSRAGDYVRNALERRFRPERFVETDTTPCRIIFQDGLMSLRSYRAVALAGEHAEELPKRLPLLLLPPLGVPAWVFDLMQSRSFVKYFALAGWDVYLVDWGSPGVVDAHLDLSHYVVNWMPKAISVVAEHAAAFPSEMGGEPGSAVPVTLLGYCMGGLLALMALGVETGRTRAAPSSKPSQRVTQQTIERAQSLVRNVVTIASPIDFHDTTGILGKAVTLANKPLGFLARRFPSAWEQVSTLMPERYFHVPGPLVAQAFALTQPLGRLTSYLNLLWNLADRSYVAQYTALSRWFDDMLDYPGGVVRNLLLEIGPENQLIRGHMTLGGRSVDLGRVQANLLAIVGETDTLVSPSAVASVMAIVRSHDKTLISAPGGHAGVFAGHSAQGNTWAQIERWLSARARRDFLQHDA